MIPKMMAHPSPWFRANNGGHILNICIWDSASWKAWIRGTNDVSMEMILRDRNYWFNSSFSIHARTRTKIVFIQFTIASAILDQSKNKKPKTGCCILQGHLRPTPEWLARTKVKSQSCSYRNLEQDVIARDSLFLTLVSWLLDITVLFGDLVVSSLTLVVTPSRNLGWILHLLRPPPLGSPGAQFSDLLLFICTCFWGHLHWPHGFKCSIFIALNFYLQPRAPPALQTHISNGPPDIVTWIFDRCVNVTHPKPDSSTSAPNLLLSSPQWWLHHSCLSGPKPRVPLPLTQWIFQQLLLALSSKYTQDLTVSHKHQHFPSRHLLPVE